MKEYYERPELDVLFLYAEEDVVTASGDQPVNNAEGEDPFVSDLYMI